MWINSEGNVSNGKFLMLEMWIDGGENWLHLKIGLGWTYYHLIKQQLTLLGRMGLVEHNTNNIGNTQYE